MALVKSALRPSHLAAFTVAAAFAAETSFDCSKATQAIEKLVCGDDQLAASTARSPMISRRRWGRSRARTRRTLRAAQAKWIESRNACAKQPDQKACTLQSYKTRIAIMGAKYGFAPIAHRHFRVCLRRCRRRRVSMRPSSRPIRRPINLVDAPADAGKGRDLGRRACRARVRAMKAMAASSSGTRAMTPRSNGRRARISTVRRTGDRTIGGLRFGPQHMADEGQFAELVRHVHAVADDEFVGTDEAAEIGFDVGGEMAGLFEQHRRQHPAGAARGE